MAKLSDRQLIYPPCIRCDCPLIIFKTDQVHRFVCVRCHEDMARKAPRKKQPCICADVQTCEKCYERERQLRKRRRTREQLAAYAREYIRKNPEKMRAIWAKANQKKRAAQKALKQSQPPKKDE